MNVALSQLERHIDQLDQLEHHVDQAIHHLVLMQMWLEQYTVGPSVCEEEQCGKDVRAESMEQHWNTAAGTSCCAEQWL